VTESAPHSDFESLYSQYRALPEGTRAEIANGEVRVLPRPRPRHVRVASSLGARLSNVFGWDTQAGPGGWVILDEPELLFGEDVRCPDLAGWRVERYEEPEDNPITLVPDWICEVLSPSTARSDRVEKMPLFAEHGVGHLWLIDPIAETLEVYRREGSLWVVASTHGADPQARPEPFGALPLDLDSLFRTPTPSARSS
jgi:Uma2 family endonuclease